MKVILKITAMCYKCNGTGKINSYFSSLRNVFKKIKISCPYCNGTGKIISYEKI